MSWDEAWDENDRPRWEDSLLINIVSFVKGGAESPIGGLEFS